MYRNLYRYCFCWILVYIFGILLAPFIQQEHTRYLLGPSTRIRRHGIWYAFIALTLLVMLQFHFFSWSRIHIILCSHTGSLFSASANLYSFTIGSFLAIYKVVYRYPPPWHCMKRLVLYQIPASLFSFCSSIGQIFGFIYDVKMSL